MSCSRTNVRTQGITLARKIFNLIRLLQQPYNSAAMHSVTYFIYKTANCTLQVFQIKDNFVYIFFNIVNETYYKFFNKYVYKTTENIK